MKLASYVAEVVKSWGVGHVFMVPGGAAMHLNDAFGAQQGISCISMLHEQAASIAAEASSRVDGNVGVALVTAGPGATNAITGLAGAWLDSTPMLILSGQVKTADLRSRELGVRQYGVQEIDIIQIVRPLTKYAETVLDPDTIRYHLEKALHLATTGRKGPVWLDLPLDIQGATIEPGLLKPYNTSEGSNTFDECDESTLNTSILKLQELLTSSKRPVLLLGNGVRSSGATDNVAALVSHLNIPVLTSWLGMDLIDQGHPLFFGRPGGMAPRGANYTLQNSDLLIVLGCRLDLGLVGYSYETFAPNARKVFVDIDSNELEKFPFPIDISLNCDCKRFIHSVLDSLEHQHSDDDSSWLKMCQTWLERYPLLEPSHSDKSRAISMYYFSHTLCELLDRECIIAPGSSGFACEIFLLMFRCKYGQRIFHNRGTGSMGFGLPSSIGACLASGLKETICIDGDGGVQMNIQELETISRLSLPIKLFVINNGGYASIRSSQNSYFGRLCGADKSSGLTLPSITKLAEAYGLKSICLDSPIDLEDQIRRLLALPGPVVIEVMVRSDEERIPRLASYKKEDGSMVSRPLEDLYPFLPRDEFNANMLRP